VLSYTKSAYTSRLVVLAIDVLFTLLAISLASILRHNFSINQALSNLWIVVPFVLIARLVSFRWFRTYAVITRYAGASDILSVFYAVTGGSLCLVGLAVLLRPYGLSMPISILLIDYFLLITAMSALRLMMPSLYQLVFGERVEKTNVLIIGAGRLGAMTRNVIRQDDKSSYEVVGILDDNYDLENKSLDGVPVIHPDQLDDLLKEVKIEKAIFAIQNITNSRKNQIVDQCLANEIQVLQVPFESSWISGGLDVRQIREVQIEDLLDRPVIVLDEGHVRDQYQDKVVMITGGAGSIGSEIVRQVIKYQPKLVVIVDQAESPIVDLGLECREDLSFTNFKIVVADVTDTSRMTKVFDEYLPNIIFHAAAYKHVPIMESYPREAIFTNVSGTRSIATLADAYEVEKFVLVSTDKAVNPTNVMGASKRIAEIFIQSFNTVSKTKFVTTRFGNVLGSNGSVVPRFRKQIAQGGPVTVTDPDITRYFMTIPEASQLVLEAGAMGMGGEIYLFDMGSPVKIANLAKKMIRLSGLIPDKDIDIVYTGLRPGEKLYEELLASKENSLDTHHPKITRAKVRLYSFDRIEELINDLLIRLDQLEDMEIVSKMKKLVPEYQSKNSRFKTLDQE